MIKLYLLISMDQRNGVWQEETINANSDTANQEELYNSEESDALSSDSFSDGDYELGWSEKVGVKGNLFYIEAAENKQKNAIEDSLAFSNRQLLQEENCKVIESRPIKKIKNWVKRQKYKPNDKTNQHASLHRSSFLPMAAFKESSDGEIEEIFLDVDPKRHNYGRRATLCEVLFGIIPRPIPNDLDNKISPIHEQDRRVMVQGFTPDGEAIGSGKIKIGDWLKSVNNIDITIDTIGDILATISTPQKVKLTIQRFVSHTNINIQQQDEYNSLLKHISGDVCSLEEMKSSHSHISHIVMYLTIGGSETSENEDGVLYKFPEEESTLLSLKGMFITLNHMVADITSSPPLSSTVVVDEQLVHVGYSREGREVMILALSDCCVKSSEIQWLTRDVARFMRLQYQTLGKALGDSENKAMLDHFFLIFFHHYISRAPRNNKLTRTDSTFTDVLPSMQLLQLSAEIEVQLHTILNEFESSDFDDMSEAYYNVRRLYTILGSCIFYKGFLLANHLPKEDLLDIFLYAKMYHLLELTAREQLSQIIIWREIFPTRQFTNSDKACNNGRDYRELDGRWFLLIVALKHTLLGVLLEAGGCSSRAQGNSPPDPFYVDQAQHTLLQLESTGVAAHIEKYLASESTPQVASPEWFGLKNKSSKRTHQSTYGKSVSTHSTGPSTKALGQKALSQSNLLNLSLTPSHISGVRKMQEVTSVLKKRTSPDGEKQHLLTGLGGSNSDTEIFHSTAMSEEMTSMLGQSERVEYSSHTSASSDADSRTSSEGALYKSQKSHRMFASAYDLSSFRKGLEEADDELDSLKTAKLVCATENTLFHYINIDTANGIFIAPTEYVHKWINGAIHREILDNFYRCCLQIRNLFQTTLQHKEAVKNRDDSKFGTNTSLNSVKEHGVLFHYTAPTNNNPRKSIPSVVYWVVGRLFLMPEPREVYVCFHDSAPQNIIEMGFRLGFGTSF